MKTFSLGGFLLLALTAVGLGGCHSDDASDGLKPENVKPVADLSTAARRVKGNYDQLTDAEKAQAIKMAGSEAQARSIVSLMAHPPAEMNAGKGPGAGGGPPKPPGG